MAPHSSTLAWKIPWMEEPGRLQSMGSLRVGHDWVTSLSLLSWWATVNPLHLLTFLYLLKEHFHITTILIFSLSVLS